MRRLTFALLALAILVLPVSTATAGHHGGPRYRPHHGPRHHHGPWHRPHHGPNAWAKFRAGSSGATYGAAVARGVNERRSPQSSHGSRNSRVSSCMARLSGPGSSSRMS